MNPAIRGALKAAVIYSALVSLFMLQAFFGRTPNDSGILVYITALPTSLSTELINYSALRVNLASILHQPVNDRFAMSMDAIIGWGFGCLQYGVLGALIGVQRAKKKLSGKA